VIYTETLTHITTNHIVYDYLRPWCFIQTAPNKIMILLILLKDDIPLKFGLQHSNFSLDHKGLDTSQIFDSLKSLATRAAAFWVMDDFHQIPMVGAPDQPMLEGWTTISVLAGITTKIKLGTLVTGVLYRYPSVLAKIAATLDVLSKGRLFLGIGASYFEVETSAYGITSSSLFPSNHERLLRVEETIQIIRKMWTEEPSASFNGKY
jgi:alkanesulfonate monooxygenase SsuD/methylene tetrahydromethanopterin reductase-like flavin-dependent oxidoreductase (luciferase family)